jgi:aspartate 1-decarboxylase
VGSITIDAQLMRESDILEYEKVTVADIDSGNRFETYVIAGEEGSGIICLNGAAAKLVEVGDKVIIMAYAGMTTREAKNHRPTVLFVDENNKLVRKAKYEKHGLLTEQE